MHALPPPSNPKEKEKSYLWKKRGLGSAAGCSAKAGREEGLCSVSQRKASVSVEPVSRQCRFKPSVAGTLPLCSLIAVSQVSGHGCQEARAVFTHFGVLESRKAPGCG